MAEPEARQEISEEARKKKLKERQAVLQSCIARLQKSYNDFPPLSTLRSELKARLGANVLGNAVKEEISGEVAAMINVKPLSQPAQQHLEAEIVTSEAISALLVSLANKRVVLETYLGPVEVSEETGMMTSYEPNAIADIKKAEGLLSEMEENLKELSQHFRGKNEIVNGMIGDFCRGCREVMCWGLVIVLGAPAIGTGIAYQVMSGASTALLYTAIVLGVLTAAALVAASTMAHKRRERGSVFKECQAVRDAARLAAESAPEP